MNVRPGFFVTGTDTGVGKTVVTAALVAALRARRRDAWPVKPVQTGARHDRSPDLDFCLRVNGLKATGEAYQQLAPVRLQLPASPHLAARKAGVRVSLRAIAQHIASLQAQGVIPVVEGAGGLLVPLNARETMLDLMQALDFPVILVARAGLGTLNHALLSAHALDSAGLDLATVILSPTSGKPGLIEQDNLDALRERLDCPVLMAPYQSRLDRAACLALGRKIFRACPKLR